MRESKIKDLTKQNSADVKDSINNIGITTKLSNDNFAVNEVNNISYCEDDFEVFFTKDQKYLDGYYNLRHSSYKYENGWKEFDGSETSFDVNGSVVVILKDGEVVAGSRLMFSDECQYLSNEIPGTQYEYSKIIRKYDERENLIVSEISSLVVKKGFRDSLLTKMLLDAMFKESERRNCHYIFAVAVVLACRNYRKILRNLKYDSEIVMNFPWKEKKTYNFMKMFPMYSKLA